MEKWKSEKKKKKRRIEWLILVYNLGFSIPITAVAAVAIFKGRKIPWYPPGGWLTGKKDQHYVYTNSVAPQNLFRLFSFMCFWKFFLLFLLLLLATTFARVCYCAAYVNSVTG